MKKIILLLIFSCVCIMPCIAQNTVYDSKHKKLEFTSEDIHLDLTKSGVKPGGEELAPVLLAAIPTILDFGFKITNNILEKKAKQYSAEYSKHNSYLEAGSQEVPAIVFTRSVAFKGGALEPALSITFKPKRVRGTYMERYVYYYISDLKLKYSNAKSTDKFPTMDYTIELKLEYVVGNEIKTLDVTPIVISSVLYESKTLPEDKYRTNLVPIPVDGVITGVSVKIVETNPGKVRAEKILSLWNDHKDGIRAIINNFLPKEEEKKDSKDDSVSSETSSTTGNGETSNRSGAKTGGKKL